MTEAERITAYVNDRVLIDAVGVLDSDFPGAVVHLTGAQLDVLRNVVAYAGRKTTFVALYTDAYYLVPTDGDWDIISDIIADLELTLMGNNNVIWGYKEQLYEPLGATLSANGKYQANTGPVPAGEVWKVEVITILNQTGDRGIVQLVVVLDGATHPVYTNVTPSQFVADTFSDVVTLQEGDRAGVSMGSCLNGDVITASVVGYKMDVPT